MKLFPIQKHRGAAPHPMQIPWRIAELAYSVYAGKYGTSQSLERLAERGGFGPGEMDMFLPGWREMCEQDAVQQAVIEEREACKAIVRNICYLHLPPNAVDRCSYETGLAIVSEIDARTGS